MAVQAERLPVETHQSISSEVVPPPPTGGEGLTFSTVPTGTQDLQENEEIRGRPPVGTVLQKLPGFTRYLETPLEQRVTEHDDGTFTVEDGPNFFDEIEAEEARIKKNADEIDLRLWKATVQEFPNITIPTHVRERLEKWNSEHPKRQIHIEDTHTLPRNLVVFPGQDNSFAADE